MYGSRMIGTDDCRSSELISALPSFYLVRTIVPLLSWVADYVRCSSTVAIHNARYLATNPSRCSLRPSSRLKLWCLFLRVRLTMSLVVKSAKGVTFQFLRIACWPAMEDYSSSKGIKGNEMGVCEMEYDTAGRHDGCRLLGRRWGGLCHVQVLMRSVQI
jgi:hypothetical protein